MSDARYFGRMVLHNCGSVYLFWMSGTGQCVWRGRVPSCCENGNCFWRRVIGKFTMGSGGPDGGAFSQGSEYWVLSLGWWDILVFTLGDGAVANLISPTLIHYAICHWEFIFESVVRLQQWIHTCFGSYLASHHQNRKLLQCWIHSSLPLHVFLGNLGDPKLSKIMLLNSLKVSVLRKVFCEREELWTGCQLWLIVLLSYSSLQITIVGVSCAWLVVAVMLCWEEISVSPDTPQLCSFHGLQFHGVEFKRTVDGRSGFWLKVSNWSDYIGVK